MCWKATRKAKDHLKLNLVREVKGNKKGFLMSVNSKRKIRENVALLLNEVITLAQSLLVT